MNSNRKEIKLGIILSYISKAIQITIGILYTPLMIRLLGQNEYGLYNISASIVSYLSVLNLGFGSAYMRFYSRYKAINDKKNISQLNGMFLIVFLILGFIAMISGLIITDNIDFIFEQQLSNNEIETAKILMFILVINLFVTFISIIFNTFLQANERFIFQNLLFIIKQVSTPLVTLPLLLLGKGSVGMVLAMTSINVICEVIIVYFCFSRLKMTFSFRNFDKELFKEMLRYSSFIFINIIVDQVNNNVDKTILGRYKGTIAVAIYSVGSKLNLYYGQFSTTISAVFTPRIHRMIALNPLDNDVSNLFIKVGRIQFIMLSYICMGFIILGQPFISFWVGNEYSDSYYITLLLMIPITVPLIQNLGIEIQRAKNMHQFRSILYFIIAILNILLSIPLSIRYGAIGSAIGTSISYILGNGLAMNWHYSSKVGLDIKLFWKEIISIIPALLLPSVVGLTIFIIKIKVTFSIFIFLGLIYSSVFMVSMWFIGLNNYEKNLLKNLFKR